MTNTNDDSTSSISSSQSSTMRNNVDEMVKVYNQGKNGSLQNNYNSPKQLPMRAAGEYQSDSSSMREDYGKEGR